VFGLPNLQLPHLEDKNTVSGMKLSQIIDIADQLFPFDLAEPWDNCGIQIGDPDRTITSVAFSLDATPQTVTFASQRACELLITHHPVLVEPIRKIVADNLSGLTLLAAARLGVDILSLHTNFDAGRGGLNDRLAEKVGLEDISVPVPATCARFGRLAFPMSLHQFAHKVMCDLEIPRPRIVAHDPDRMVSTVFCVSGSGMGYLRDALTYKADVMLTGDVKYHAAREALEMDLPVIDAGHFGSEKIGVGLMVECFGREFKKRGVGIACHQCNTEKEPFMDIIDRKEDY
jgi:dinuclear metal center YbgI/SA1388 family protein